MPLTLIQPSGINSSANFTFAVVNATANLNVTGISNLGPNGNIIITGGSSGQVLSTNGSGGLSWIPVGNYNTIVSGNSNVNIPSVNGNVTIGINGVSNTAVFTQTGANFAGTLNVTGNGTFANISGGNLVNANFLTGTLTTPAQPNITSVGNLTVLTVTGNIAGGNVNAGNLLTANFVQGVLTTAAQPNITSLGTLGSLTTTGNVSVGNVLTVSGVSNLGPIGNVIITGGSNGQVLTTNGSGGLSWANGGSGTGTSISNGNSNVNIPAANGNITMTVAGNSNIVVVTGTGINVAGTGNFSGNLSAGNVVTGSGSGGSITGANLISANVVNVATNLNVTGVSNLGPVGNVIITGGSNGQVLTTNGSGNLSWTSVGSGSNISNGNSNVNIPTANGNINLSVTGNSNVVVVTGTGINVAGTGNFTGNLTAGNFVTGSGTGGSITGANLISANIANISANLNVTGVSNLGPNGNVIITGGSNGQFLQTNGSGALSWATISTAGISNGNSNISIPAANGNVNISAVGNANILVVTGTGVNIAGTSNTTGSIVGGGNLNISGNAVIGGNLTVNGNLAYVNVTDLSVSDPIIQLQSGPNGAAPTSNTGKDVGTALNYFDTAARVAFMGWDVSNAEIAFGSNVSIASEVVTFNALANIRSGNAQLGNLATANFLSGTLTTASQPNITSVGTLSTLAVTGNITAGNFIGSFANGNSVISIPAANGNINLNAGGTASPELIVTPTGVNVVGTFQVTGVSNLGPVGNVIITGGSNGQVLTTNGSGGLSWANSSGGGGSSISNGNSNVNIATANGNVTISVTGNANVMTVTGTGANITGTLNATGNLTVGGKSNLGPVGNVIVTGGTTGQYLQTDGAGNLSWGSVTPMSAVSDNFTGNGVQTTFTLSTTPANINLTYINYNGALLQRSSYSLSGSNVIFSAPPANGSAIEVTTMSGSLGAGVAYSRTSATATAGQTTFSVSYVPGYLQVFYNGALIVPTTDYTATNGTSVVLVDPAAVGDLLEFVAFTTTTTTVATPATLNSTTLNSNLIITAGYSAVSVGPITIANGVSVSIASGQKWVIL